MSAETIIQEVLMQIGIDRSNPQVNAADLEMRQILEFMNASGQEIATRAEWQKMYVALDVTGNQSDIDLPSDFQKLASTGAVRLGSTGYSPVRVVTDPETWGFLVGRPSSTYYCHIAEGRINFSPTLPPAGARVRYVKDKWLADDKEAITENGDILLIPDHLVTLGTVWRWKRQKGLPYDDNVAEYEAAIIAAIKADRGEA